MSTPPDLAENAFTSSLLLLTVDSIEPPHYLAHTIASAARATRERLVIIILSQLFEASSSTAPGGGEATARREGISHIGRWDDVQRLLTWVYVEATKVAQDMDKVLMSVDMLLRGASEGIPEQVHQGLDVSFAVHGDTAAVSLLSGLQQQFITLPSSQSTSLASPTVYQDFPGQPSEVRVVALGGTFDHLHAGHKILLSMAAWIASERIIVGMTDDVLLKNKANKEVMEDLSERSARVRDFLSLFRPGLVYDVVPIRDVAGPTGWDPDVQALVVSKETLSGASAIHRIREDKKLPPLRTFVIDVISSSSTSLEGEAEALKQAKMSSTYIREWIVQKRRNPPG